MISIQARQEDGKLYVDVFNSGELQAKDKNSTGIGVTNTQNKLKSLYEGQASLELSNSGEYVKASIIIPYRKKYESTDH
jgi:LytS/YehU family sensor histidine kinase